MALNERAELTTRRPKLATETQEVVGRDLERVLALFENRNDREEVAGHFPTASPIIQILTPISDSPPVFIDKE